MQKSFLTINHLVRVQEAVKEAESNAAKIAIKLLKKQEFNKVNSCEANLTPPKGKSYLLPITP